MLLYISKPYAGFRHLVLYLNALILKLIIEMPKKHNLEVRIALPIEHQ